MSAFSFQLDKRISIEQRSAGRDAAGQPAAGWTAVASVWANIRHLSGMETAKAGGEVPVVRASIRIRYRTGLNSGMRVKHGTTVYDIKAVLPDLERKAHVDLVCEVVNA